MPDLPNAVQVHAAARIDSAGNILNSVNISSVVRNGAGDYTVTLAEGIDPSDRVSKVQPVNAAFRGASVDTETDTSLQVLTATGNAVATDSDFTLLVKRKAVG